MLHSEYTTRFMASSVVGLNFQSSSNKQARQTFQCFVLNSHFIQPSECKYCLFVCLSVRLQLSSIPIRFSYFGQRFSFRTVDLSRDSRVVPCATHSTIFAEKNKNYFFLRMLPIAKINRQKIIPMFFIQYRKNLATRNYPIIWYLLESYSPLSIGKFSHRYILIMEKMLSPT